MAISLSRYSTPAHPSFTGSAPENVQSDPCLRDVQKKPTMHKFHVKSSSCDPVPTNSEKITQTTEDKKSSYSFKKYLVEMQDFNILEHCGPTLSNYNTYHPDWIE